MAHLIAAQPIQIPLSRSQPSLKIFLHSTRLQRFLQDPNSLNLIPTSVLRYSEQQQEQAILQQDLFISSNFQELSRQIKKHSRAAKFVVPKCMSKVVEEQRKILTLLKKNRIDGFLKSNRLRIKASLLGEARIIAQHKEVHHDTARGENQQTAPNLAKMTFLLQRLSKKQKYQPCLTDPFQTQLLRTPTPGILLRKTMQGASKTVMIVILVLLGLGFLFFIVHTIRCYINKPRTDDDEDYDVHYQEQPRHHPI